MKKKAAMEEIKRLLLAIEDLESILNGRDLFQEQQTKNLAVRGRELTRLKKALSARDLTVSEQAKALRGLSDTNKELSASIVKYAHVNDMLGKSVESYSHEARRFNSTIKELYQEVEEASKYQKKFQNEEVQELYATLEILKEENASVRMERDVLQNEKDEYNRNQTDKRKENGI